MTDPNDAFNQPEENPLAQLADAPPTETVDNIKEAVKKAAEKKENNK